MDVQREHDRAEAWKRIALDLGACFCQVDAVEQHCFDCMGTGFDHGEDPRELLKQLAVRLSKYERVEKTMWYPGSPTLPPQDVL